MSIKIEAAIWIRRPAHEVFDFITDSSKLSSYVPGVVEAHQMGSERGVGTVVACKVAVLGTKMDIESKWTRYEPGVALGAKNTKGMPVESLTTFHPHNGGTRVERVLKLEPKGVFGSLAGPLVRRTADRNSKSELAALKELLEAGQG